MDTISSLSALPHEIYFWYMPCIKPFGTCHVLNLWYMPCIKPFGTCHVLNHLHIPNIILKL